MEQEIEKALRAIAQAIEGNDAVKRVDVKITLVKQKPSKASESEEHK